MVPISTSYYLSDFLVFSFILRGKNHHNLTKIIISVEIFVNSVYSHLPVNLLIYYFSLLYHFEHIGPAGEWNHQCWKDIFEVDY